MLKTVGFPSTRTGDQTIVDGNLIIGTAGKGIDFSATPGTGTSELLADYEEGNWTPTLALASGSVGYGSRDGKYIKVGNVVTVNTWILLSSVSSPTGNLTIALPFAMGSAATRPDCFILSNNLTGVTGQTAGWMYQSDNVLYLVVANNGSSSALQGTNLASNSELYISMTYTVA